MLESAGTRGTEPIENAAAVVRSGKAGAANVPSGIRRSDAGGLYYDVCIIFQQIYMYINYKRRIKLQKAQVYPPPPACVGPLGEVFSLLSPINEFAPPARPD